MTARPTDAPLTKCVGCDRMIYAKTSDLCWRCRAQRRAEIPRCECGAYVKKVGESECYQCRTLRAVPATQRSSRPHVSQRYLVQHDPIASRYRWANVLR